MSKTLGAILIALGLIAPALGSFNYTTREKVIDIGPVHASRDKSHYVNVPPLVGGLLLVAGIVLIATGRKTS